MNLAQKLWADEAGIVVSTELILIVLILVLGLIAGMAALRDAVAQELGDLGEAINALDGSYQFAGNTYDSAPTAGNQTEGPSTTYIDDSDSNNVQTADAEPHGMDIDGALNAYAATGEDGA